MSGEAATAANLGLRLVAQCGYVCRLSSLVSFLDWFCIIHEQKLKHVDHLIHHIRHCDLSLSSSWTLLFSVDRPITVDIGMVAQKA